MQKKGTKFTEKQNDMNKKKASMIKGSYGMDGFMELSFDEPVIKKKGGQQLKALMDKERTEKRGKASGSAREEPASDNGVSSDDGGDSDDPGDPEPPQPAIPLVKVKQDVCTTLVIL